MSLLESNDAQRSRSPQDGYKSFYCGKEVVRDQY
jgi:hypothetical protein